MMSISNVFGHSDCIWMFITSVCFGYQKERGNHNITKEHNSQDTVTLFVVVEKRDAIVFVELDVSCCGLSFKFCDCVSHFVFCLRSWDLF